MQENPGFSFVSISKDSYLDEILSNSVFTKRSVIFPVYILIFSIAEVLAVIDPVMGLSRLFFLSQPSPFTSQSAIELINPLQNSH